MVLVLLIVGWILANIILPKATITISTQTSAVNSNLTIILNTSASSVNQTSLTLPAHSQQVQKAITQSVSTTGQVNNGTPATGAVTMVEYTNCVSLPQTIPAHIGISSTNNITFIINQLPRFQLSHPVSVMGNASLIAVIKMALMLRLKVRGY